MRISDWSSDVCSSDLRAAHLHHGVVDDADEFLPAGEEGLAVAALGRLQVVVQVTVADMDEADQPRPVVDPQDPFSRSVIELGDARARHRTAMLDSSALALSPLACVSPSLPESAACRLRL